MATSKKKAKLTPIAEAMFRIKRGLCGYISYLSACGMSSAFSEYVLYEPILRILTARRFSVQCEYECPGVPQPKQGDKKRLDFYAKKDTTEFALEVKWLRAKTANLSKDYEKLIAFRKSREGSRAFLCLFGTRSLLEKVVLDAPSEGVIVDYGKAVYADFRRTKFGCKVYELRPANNGTGSKNAAP